MGNSGSHPSSIPKSALLPPSSDNSIRIMLSDGTLQQLSAPIPASHLHQNPDFLLCDSLTLRVGKRPCPLRPYDCLRYGHLYVLLPISAFQRRLSWSYLSAIVATFSASEGHLRPRRRRRRRAGQGLPCAGGRVFNVCDSEEVLSRYIDQLIDRSNSWQPKLETIDEISGAAIGSVYMKH